LRPCFKDVDVLIDETYHFAVKDADKTAVLAELGINEVGWCRLTLG
jgi:hypothetical protein